LKKASTGRSETSTNNYKSTLRDIAKERISHLQSGKRLKSRIFNEFSNNFHSLQPRNSLVKEVFLLCRADLKS